MSVSATLRMSFHCIVHVVRNDGIPLQSPLDLEHFHILWLFNSFSFFATSAYVCKSTFEDTICNLFLPKLVAVVITYRGNNWTNLEIHQPVQVSIEINAISKAYDPYCCKITITRRNRIGAVTVGHIPREPSWFVYYFLQEGPLHKK